VIRAVKIACSLGVFAGLVTAKAVYVGGRHLVGAA